VIPGPGTSPLLYSGTLAGRPAAVLAFEPRRSDLPLQVAFPVLLANLAGELLGGSETPLDAVAPGAPVTLAITTAANGVPDQPPDGSGDELVAPTRGAGSVTFARTDQLGVYTVTGIPDPDASPGSASPSQVASVGGTPAASAGATASPGASPTFRPADPGAPARFAVDLLDVDESNIAPGDVGRLTALGRPTSSPAASPGASADTSPGASAGTGSGTGQPGAVRPNARDELWIPIVLIALLVLTAEWLVYERDTLARLRRGVAARLRRTRPAGKGA